MRAVHQCLLAVQEPLKKWCDVDGHNLLKMLYEDPARWAFLFQSYIQLTRLQIHLDPSPCRVKIIERSLQNNRSVVVGLWTACVVVHLD